VIFQNPDGSWRVVFTPCPGHAPHCRRCTVCALCLCFTNGKTNATDDGVIVVCPACAMCINVPDEGEPSVCHPTS
jgi:hypothetical protein